MSKLRLTNPEKIAYLMVNIIKTELNNLLNKSTPLTNEEKEFINKFYGNTLKDWRKIYLELTDYITNEKKKKVNLNKGISQVLGCSIGLCFKDQKTNFIEESIPYYKDDYILFENDELLELSHLLITIIKKLNENNINLTTEEFKCVFCQTFTNFNGKLYSLEEIFNMFDIAISWAIREKIIYNGNDRYYYLDPNRFPNVPHRIEPSYLIQYDIISQEYLDEFTSKKLKLEK